MFPFPTGANKPKEDPTLDHFKCLYCKNVAKMAVEASCCGALYCGGCTKHLLNCNGCKAFQWDTKPSHLARKVIENQPKKCEHCGTEIKDDAHAKSHPIDCAKVLRKCKIENCNFSGTSNELIKHVSAWHQRFIVQYFDQALQQKQFGFPAVVQPDEKKPEEKKNPNLFFKPGEQLDLLEEKLKEQEKKAKEEKEKLNQKVEEPPLDAIQFYQNRGGFEARRGLSGKFYCCRENTVQCDCCNGQCGPADGCNCRDCMELDLNLRKLPNGYFINRDGHMCRKAENNNFYCGCCKLQTGDGYCGPHKGDQCSSCYTIQYYKYDFKMYKVL